MILNQQNSNLLLPTMLHKYTEFDKNVFLQYGVTVCQKLTENLRKYKHRL